MIVEDDRLSRLLIERTLASYGFTRLLSVMDGEQALSQLESFNPDLMLLDIITPGMSGYECCEKIRMNPKFRDLPVLVHTSLSRPEDRVRAFASGATDFVSKPIFPAELCARVITHLEKRHLLSDLKVYKERVQQELDAARQLQMAILPGKEEIECARGNAMLEVASYFCPSSEVGGDLWGIKNLEGACTALWNVDFSGHGVSSALNAFRLQAYLMEYSALSMNPGAYLSLLNDKLRRLMNKGSFATMIYLTIDAQKGLMRYASACTPSPLLLRGDSGKVEVIDGSGLPLGIMSHDYLEMQIDIRPGDVLVLYSDAWLETPGENGGFIDSHQLCDLLESMRGQPVGVIQHRMMEYFNEHSGDNVVDDVTLVVCRVVEAA